MELARALILLIAGTISLIKVLIDLWRWIIERRPPTSHPEPHPRPPIIRRGVAWIVGRSTTATAFFSGVAAMGLLVGGFLLPAALEPNSPDVEILSPVQGDAVAQEIFVEGNARQREDGESLVVLVRPFPDSPFQDYHAQAFPQQIDKRRWDARPIYVGIPEDQPGTPFKVCAVITRSQISPGDRLRMLPAGPSDCVLVTRE